MVPQQLRDRMNGIARRSLAPVPLPFWERAFPKDLIALCYHMVSDEDLRHFALFPYKTSAQFEADVLFARERAVTYRQAADSRLHGASLPPNSLLFTFDDGMAQCYTVIRPILQRYGVDAVFFVTTEYLDDRASFLECTISRCLTAAAALPLERIDAILAKLEGPAAPLPVDDERERKAMQRLPSIRIASDDLARRRLFLWLLALEERDRALVERACELLGLDAVDSAPHFMSHAEVRQLAADGFTIGAHGLTHRSLEGLDPLEIEHEVVASCEAVRELTGQERVPFAFPYTGLAVERREIGEIIRRNDVVDLVFDSGCLRRDPNYIVNRVFVDAPPATKAITNLPASLREAWSVPSSWFRSAASAARS